MCRGCQQDGGGEADEGAAIKIIQEYNDGFHLKTCHQRNTFWIRIRMLNLQLQYSTREVSKFFIQLNQIPKEISSNQCSFLAKGFGYLV